MIEGGTRLGFLGHSERNINETTRGRHMPPPVNYVDCVYVRLPAYHRIAERGAVGIIGRVTSDIML